MKEKRKKTVDFPISISTLIVTLTAILVTIGVYIFTSKPTEDNVTQEKQELEESSEKNQETFTSEKLEQNVKTETEKNSSNETQKETLNQPLIQTINPINDSQNSELKEKILNLAKQRNLPLNKLSFTLFNWSEYSCLNIKQSNSICVTNYQDQVPRYPASIVKLFWMVFAYQQNPNPSEEFKKQLADMIIDSDNEASSMVVDTITNTKSTKVKLSNQEFQQWKSQRDYLNRYFYSIGFNNINISQKTFPIPYLNMNMPEGVDLQLRHPNGEEKPFRNKLSSYHVALLLYQIYSQQYHGSNEMLLLLKRDLTPSAWQNVPYNAIAGFLGEGIPDKNAIFYSKMGWTFSGRNDGAIVISPDQKARYIFVILGDDPAFYEDKTFYPEVSKLVYEEMLKSI